MRSQSLAVLVSELEVECSHVPSHLARSRSTRNHGRDTWLIEHPANRHSCRFNAAARCDLRHRLEKVLKGLPPAEFIDDEAVLHK